MKSSNSDDKATSVGSDDRSPRKRLRRLSERFPIRRVLPRPSSAFGFGAAVVVIGVVFAAIALVTPAGEVVKSYATRLWDLMF